MYSSSYVNKLGNCFIVARTYKGKVLKVHVQREQPRFIAAHFEHLTSTRKT